MTTRLPRPKAATLLVLAVVSPAFSAGFTYDLRFIPGTTGLVDSHNVNIYTTGSSYTLQLWGQITGVDNTYANDGFVHGFVGVGSTQSLGGGFSTGGIVSGVVNTNLFSAPASINGGSGTVTADGISDWGSADTSNPNNWMLWQATAGQPPGYIAGTVTTGSQAVNSTTWEVLLATFTVNPTGTVTPGGTTNYNVLSGLSGTVVTSVNGTLTTAPAIINCIDTAGGTNAQTQTALATSGVNFLVPTVLNIPNGNTVTLANANTFSATNIFAGGVLNLSNGGLLNGSGTITNNGNLNFNNTNAANHTAPITGTGSITQAGAGTTTLSGLYNATGAISIGAGRLVLGTGTIRTNNLTITPGTGSTYLGTLDITNHRMVVDTTGATGNKATVLTAIRAELAAGRASGFVGNGGITSSTVVADKAASVNNTTVVVADNALLKKSVFGSASVDASSLLIQRAVIGDGNLDGLVNFSDFTVLSTNFGKSSANWAMGDYNQDGLVNFSDFTQLSTNFGKTLSGEVNLLPSGSTSAVPEPASIALLGLSSLLLLRRRKCPYVPKFLRMNLP